MNVTETLNTGLKREFQVVVNSDELARLAEARLAEMAGKAQIKGFRPGKVPVAHLKRLYGKSVMAEVVQKSLEDSTRTVFADRNLKPAYQPEVKLPEAEDEVNAVMDGKKDLSFSISGEVIPDFEVKDTTGLELAKHVVAVTDANIDEAIANLSSSSKNWEAKAAGAKAANGDRVTISFEGKVDGVAFEGGTGEDIPLELGSNQFIPGFEEQLVGAKVGDELVVKVSFPADYAVDTLAGKPAEFTTKVSAIETGTGAAVDDEFAKRMGFENVGALREMVKSSLAREFERMTAMKLKRDVLDALDKQYTFDLPERLVETEFSSIWTALNNEMQKAGKTFADEDTTEEKARDEYRAIAARRVRLGLVLGMMGEKEGVNVNEQELQQALIARVRQFPGQERQVYDFYRKNPSALIELRGPIFEQKVVDLIVAKASLSEKSVSREDLKKMVEDDLDSAA
ncbi:MAG: trigger factor [Proteobacteria bacterium]|nr:trigger factor [Pseudomonadota bacterium]